MWHRITSGAAGRPTGLLWPPRALGVAVVRRQVRTVSNRVPGTLSNRKPRSGSSRHTRADISRARSSAPPAPWSPPPRSTVSNDGAHAKRRGPCCSACSTCALCRRPHDRQPLARPHGHTSRSLGPERLSGSSRVRSAARSWESEAPGGEGRCLPIASIKASDLLPGRIEECEDDTHARCHLVSKV